MAQQNPWEYMWDLKDFIPLPLQINQLIAGLHAFNHCDNLIPEETRRVMLYSYTFD